MQCQYCLAINNETEGRCSRCGRRLPAVAARPAPEGHVPGAWATAATATAPALEERLFETLEGGRGSGSESVAEKADEAAYQQPLFREGLPSKVIPIPTFTPVRRAQTATRESGRKAPRAGAQSSGARGHAPSDRAAWRLAQQDLFRHGEPDLTPSAEVICCDAPVALPVHRMMAVAMDWSLILIATGLIMGIFLLAGGEIVLDRQTAAFLLGVVVVLALFYRVLWVIADGDTPGMRFAGLRLVDFDGRRPQPHARAMRQASALLSLCSLGLGMVWALVDEESLTWHDHISKTFPTVG